MAHSRFQRFLGFTGVAAIIVVVEPASFVYGLLLGGLPGLFLMIAPALFIYLVVWWGLKWLVVKLGVLAGLDTGRRQVRWTANLVSVAIVLVLAFKIPAAFNAPQEREIAQLQSTDVQHPGAVKLPAVVAIELPKSFHSDRPGEGPYCEAICQRLLYNGAVARVIAAARSFDSKIELASYRIERRDQCPPFDLPRYRVVWPEEHLALGKTPMGAQERVQARISAGECLVREAARIEDAETVISIRSIKTGAHFLESPYNPWLDTVSSRRLEIVEANGRVLYRRTEVTAALLLIPLRSTAGAGLLSTVTYSGWARTAASDTRLLGMYGQEILAGLLGEEVSRLPDLPDTARP